MLWHEGMLSGGYEIRRLTGKLDLIGKDWILLMESCHVDLRLLIMMRIDGYKKMSQALGH
jgi:hypothetical protein